MLTQGMAHFHDQEKDRLNWQKSIQERTRLVTQIKKRKIKTPIDPHNMKLVELRGLLNG